MKTSDLIIDAQRAEIDRLKDAGVHWKARAEAAERRLSVVMGALEELITHFEDGDSHNEGAFDPECPDCAALEKARSALALGAGERGNEKAAFGGQHG